MTRRELLLAILASSNGRPFSPVQIQKAAFLVTENMPRLVNDGPTYHFAPYDYGPFDVAVYNDAEVLRNEGLVEISQAPGARWNRYAACDEGIEQGQEILDGLQPRVQDYINRVSAWVRGQSFEQLVKSIYDAYPDMRANSIFRG